MVYRAHHEVASLWRAQIMEHMDMKGHRRTLVGQRWTIVATTLRVFKAIGPESHGGRLL